MRPLNHSADWIPVTTGDWAECVLFKLESLGWRFSLDADGRLTVRIGRPLDNVPTEALMELLGQWSNECAHILRERDDDGTAALLLRPDVVRLLQEGHELAQRVDVQAQRLGADDPDVVALRRDIEARQAAALAVLARLEAADGPLIH